MVLPSSDPYYSTFNCMNKISNSIDNINRNLYININLGSQNYSDDPFKGRYLSNIQQAGINFLSRNR